MFIPTPLFNKNDLDWSNYKGKVLGGWEHVLLGVTREIEGKYI